MATDTNSGESSPTAKVHSSLEMGPFVLRPLLEHVPLSADDAEDEVKINCVEYLGLQSSPQLCSLQGNN